MDTAKAFAAALTDELYRGRKANLDGYNTRIQDSISTPKGSREQTVTIHWSTIKNIHDDSWKEYAPKDMLIVNEFGEDITHIIPEDDLARLEREMYDYWDYAGVEENLWEENDDEDEA